VRITEFDFKYALKLWANPSGTSGLPAIRVLEVSHCHATEATERNSTGRHPPRLSWAVTSLPKCIPCITVQCVQSFHLSAGSDKVLLSRRTTGNCSNARKVGSIRRRQHHCLRSFFLLPSYSTFLALFIVNGSKMFNELQF